MKNLTKRQIIVISSVAALCALVIIISVIIHFTTQNKEEIIPEATETTSAITEEPFEEPEKSTEKTSEEPELEFSEEAPEEAPEEPPLETPASTVGEANCTLKYGPLMLINPNFTVSTDFIANRATELISLSSTYGIPEHHAYNGDNLLDPTAAEHLNEMVKAYEAAFPGHTLGTMSCFRRIGTSCGRLCLATGTSEHHSGYTCDLIDTAYGSGLDTDTYGDHLDWQWLHANSYKYGFIDRYIEEWAGGPMSGPMNLDETGTTGLFETWHYRYVGNPAATEIATGKYNGGAYDSLEHYLKSTGRVASLTAATCE